MHYCKQIHFKITLFVLYIVTPSMSARVDQFCYSESCSLGSMKVPSHFLAASNMLSTHTVRIANFRTKKLLTRYIIIVVEFDEMLVPLYIFYPRLV